VQSKIPGNGIVLSGMDILKERDAVNRSCIFAKCALENGREEMKYPGLPRVKLWRKDDWMKNAYWDHFVETGKVEDYLCYRGMEICQQTMDLYRDREKTLGWAGEQTSESGSDSDGDDLIGSPGGRLR
jgi:hypothetical protein